MTHTYKAKNPTRGFRFEHIQVQTLPFTPLSIEKLSKVGWESTREALSSTCLVV